MTTDARPTTARRPPSPGQLRLLRLFHALMSGAFLTAYLTGGEDAYGIHVVAGYVVLGALGFRLLMALAAPGDSVLRLPRPSLSALAAWLGRLPFAPSKTLAARSPLHGFVGVAVLAGTALAASSGAIADYLPGVEDLHEALGELALFLALFHGALVFLLAGLKRAVRPSHPEIVTP